MLQLSNEHNSRVASRMGQGWAAAAGMLLLSLPGTPIIYYGDEIGMHDVAVSFEETKDPVGIKFGQVRLKINLSSGLCGFSQNQF